jgi:starvation-inducible DNA-binding protein
MHRTKNSLSEQVRGQSIQLLQGRLAEAIDVMLQTKQAHWNVKGDNFFSLHKLFDEVNSHSREWVDLMAERIIQLGGVAEGTRQAIEGRSKLAAYPLDIFQSSEHVEALSSCLAAFGDGIRKAIQQSEEFNDPATSDIFTEISRDVDQYVWMIEAHQSQAAQAARRAPAA